MPKKQGGEQQVILHKAIENGKATDDFIKKTIKAGAKVNHQRDPDKMTPLHVALAEGQFEAIKMLFKHGADPQVSCKDGLQAIHHAARKKDLPVATLDLLCKNNADPCKMVKPIKEGGKWGEFAMWTPLHFAASCGNCEIIKHLLELGSSVNEFSMNKKQPIEIAADHQQWEAVLCLIEGGADPNSWKGDKSAMIFHMALLTAEDNVVSSMIDRGAKVHLACKMGFRPVHLTCAPDRISLLEILLRKGAKADDKTKNGGLMLLHVAAQQGSATVSEYCLENGSQVDEYSEHGYSPLYYAVSRSNQEAIKAIASDMKMSPTKQAKDPNKDKDEAQPPDNDTSNTQPNNGDESTPSFADQLRKNSMKADVAWDLLCNGADPVGDCFAQPGESILHQLAQLPEGAEMDVSDQKLLLNALLWKECPVEQEGEGQNETNQKEKNNEDNKEDADQNDPKEDTNDPDSSINEKGKSEEDNGSNKENSEDQKDEHGGKHPPAGDIGLQPLTHALKCESLEIVVLLLAHGANPDTPQEYLYSGTQEEGTNTKDGQQDGQSNEEDPSKESKKREESGSELQDAGKAEEATDAGNTGDEETEVSNTKVYTPEEVTQKHIQTSLSWAIGYVKTKPRKMTRALIQCGYNRSMLGCILANNQLLPPPMTDKAQEQNAQDPLACPEWLVKEAHLITLKFLSRIAVRKQLKEHFRNKSIVPGVMQLPLENDLQRFLLLEDFGVSQPEIDLFFRDPESKKLEEKKWPQLKEDLHQLKKKERRERKSARNDKDDKKEKDNKKEKDKDDKKEKDKKSKKDKTDKKSKAGK